MTDILPKQTGLTVGGVLYRYTTEKNAQDDMLVHIQNENALGTGYIFKETDDWSGLPGNTINKLVPVDNIDISFWGDGSIEVEGDGSVKNPSVIYTYRYDPCYNPQSSPECIGYVEPYSVSLQDIDIYDPLNEDYIQNELDRNRGLPLNNDEEEERDRKKVSEEDVDDERLEKALGITNTTALAAVSLAMHNELVSLSMIPISYNIVLPTTVYEETVRLPTKELPDSKKGLRNRFAQQILHQRMIDLQYGK
jgi:hypothetical protein